MSEFVTENWKYLLVALLLHVALGVMLTISIHSTQQPVIPFQSAIQGVIVDHSSQRLKRERAEQQRLANEKADAEAAAKAQADANQKAAEQKAADQKAADQKVAEQKLAAQKVAAQKILEHQQQIAAQEKQRAAMQAQKQSVERKQKAAQDAKRVADIKQKQAEKLHNEQAARDKAQRENELKQQLAAEEGRMQAQKSGMLNQYAAQIEQQVERNWNKPPSAVPGIECTITLTQAPGGSVLSVQIGKCNGDQAVRQSIEAAVYRSSPLPPPPDMRLFERVIVFVFKPTA